MKNIRLERQYLHKNTFKIHQLSKRQVEELIQYKLLSLLANPKGYDAIASICANAHKNFSKEREYV